MRRPRWIRTTAWLCLTFLALASGRGLLPGLCANLLAPEERAAAADAAYWGPLIGPAPSCCAMTRWRPAPAPAETPDEDAPAPAAPISQGDCAFCALASARMLPLTHQVHEPPQAERIAAIPNAPMAIRPAPCANPIRGRAPPLPFLAA